MPALPAVPRRTTSARRRAPLGAVGVLLALAVVTTAAAPGVLRIAPGDTLSELARRHGTTVEALRAANGLAAGDRIYAGQTLTLPSARTASATASTSEKAHTVARGETVTSIAQRYGTSVRAVQDRNGLASSSLLQPGQSLVVPVTVRTVGGSTAPTTSSTTASGTVSASAAQHRAQLAARPVPSREQVRTLVARTAAQYGVDPSLALAVAYQESGFQQRVVSGVDAIGVMQVLPSTGRGLSAQLGRQLDLLRTEDNVTAGVVLLKTLLRSEGSESAALAGYYQGIGSIAAKGILPQTTQYLRSIEALRPRFRTG